MKWTECRSNVPQNAGPLICFIENMLNYKLATICECSTDQQCSVFIIVCSVRLAMQCIIRFSNNAVFSLDNVTILFYASS